jgi:AbrB family looped-hinge helix DNA binding protein
MSNPNTITIDTAGRVVIPKSIREEAGIRPGMPLSVVCRDGRIEIEPQLEDVRVVDRGGIFVAEPTRTSREPLSIDAVEATRDRLRKRDSG